MSAETKNLYSGDNKFIAEIYDSLVNGKERKEAILLLLQSNAIETFDKFKIIRLLSEKSEKYYQILMRLIADNTYLLENKTVFSTFQNFFFNQTRTATLISDEEILRYCRYILYLIGQGFADFYPFIRQIINRHGQITAYSNSDLKIISHYAAVFAFDGYNDKLIKEVLKNSPMCSEQSFDIFKQLKSKKEKAYSQYAKAILYIMRKAFKEYRPDYDKFNEYLLEIPVKYKEELYIDSLLKNSERLYANLFRFYKNGGSKRVHCLNEIE